MRLFEFEHTPKLYFHTSMHELSVGTILRPSPNYETNWDATGFYHTIEYFRPSEMLAHKNAVFMADEPDHGMNDGDWAFIVEPLGNVTRHDLRWENEINDVISNGHLGPNKDCEQAALNYWNGVKHPKHNGWEYLTPSARIVWVDDIDDLMDRLHDDPSMSFIK